LCCDPDEDLSPKTEPSETSNRRPWTEFDAVFKAPSPNQLASLYLDYYQTSLNPDPPPGLRNEINRLCKTTRARRPRSGLPSGLFGFRLHFDPEQEEYILIQPGVYSAANLLYALFDILVGTPSGNPDVLQTGVFEDIDRYLGRIEEKEKRNFNKQKEELKRISGELIQTLAILDEQDFKEQDMEKLAAEIDKTYYEPLGLILQTLLIEIEKPPASPDETGELNKFL
jgi:hypothetical protein